MKEQVTQELRNQIFVLKSYQQVSTIEQLSEWIEEIKEDGITGFEIEIEKDWDGCVEGIELVPYKTREETDTEYKQRLEFEESLKITWEKNLELIKQSEIAQLKALKEKYPNE